MFEIGMIYLKQNQAFLAVCEKSLITMRKGKVKEHSPKKPDAFSVARQMEVDELCANWKISSEQLDTISAKYMTPDPIKIRTAPLGSGRFSRAQRLQEEVRNRSMRIGRIRVGV